MAGYLFFQQGVSAMSQGSSGKRRFQQLISVLSQLIFCSIMCLHRSMSSFETPSLDKFRRSSIFIISFYQILYSFADSDPFSLEKASSILFINTFASSTIINTARLTLQSCILSWCLWVKRVQKLVQNNLVYLCQAVKLGQKKYFKTSNQSFGAVTKRVLELLQKQFRVSPFGDEMVVLIVPPTVLVIQTAWWVREQPAPALSFVGFTGDAWDLGFPALGVINIAWQRGYFSAPAVSVARFTFNGFFELVSPAVQIIECAFVSKILKSLHCKRITVNIVVIIKGGFVFQCQATSFCENPRNPYKG